MNLKQNYFELFELPESWEVDDAVLGANYRRLQQEAHPDRFAASSSSEQRRAVQFASLINEAYDTLKKPLSRGIYLLGLRGVVVEMENNTLMDSAFLMQQMMLRDELSEITNAQDPEAALDLLRARIDALVAQFQQQFADLWQSSEDSALSAGADTLRKMQFLLRLDEEAERLESQLLDEL